MFFKSGIKKGGKKARTCLVARTVVPIPDMPSGYQKKSCLVGRDGLCSHDTQNIVDRGPRGMPDRSFSM